MLLLPLFLQVLGTHFVRLLRHVAGHTHNPGHPVNITDGAKGLGLIDSIGFFGLDLGKTLSLGDYRIASVTQYYYLFLSLVVLTVSLCHRLQVSRIGCAWMAIRDDEVAAEAMGIHAACRSPF